MSATVFYDNVNEIALIANTFQSGSPLAAADPTTVSCVITDPAGVSVTHTYAAASPADIVKASAGKYTLSVPCSPSAAGIDGLWSYNWIGTGAVSDVQPGTWRVLPVPAGIWYCGLDELKSRLGLADTGDDYEAQMAIQSVSGWINEYCVVPETPVLTADLRWVPAGELVRGQQLIGVDEEPVPAAKSHDGAAGWLQRSNRNRFYRRAEVLGTPRRLADCVRLVLSDGREVISAADHRWLARRFLSSRERQHYGLPSSSRNGGYRWVRAREVVPGDEIASPLRVWPDETSFEAGWVAGLFDGEGWLSGQNAKRTNRIGIGQNPGPVLDGILKYLENTGIPYNRDDSRSCVNVEISSRWAAMELMGRLRPRRLMPRGGNLWEDGRVIRAGDNSVRVTAAEPAGVREVVSLSTSTGTYLANGLISHNCGRHFNRITETRTYQPGNLWLLEIDDLVSVSAVSMDLDGDGVFETAMTRDTDYQLRLGNGLYNVNATGIARPYRQLQIIQTGKWFPFTWPYTHLDRVQVTGTWGWPSVPPPVSQAALILSADIFKFKDAPFGVAGVNDYGVVRIQSNPWLVALLRPFINPRRKVGV